MALPTLTPTSTTSAIVLPKTGSTDNVVAACPIGAYVSSVDFITGAVAQVAYTYKKLGGDVLDLEITEQNVYANYEEACLEYSYIINTLCLYTSYVHPTYVQCLYGVCMYIRQIRTGDR